MARDLVTYDKEKRLPYAGDKGCVATSGINAKQNTAEFISVFKEAYDEVYLKNIN